MGALVCFLGRVLEFGRGEGRSGNRRAARTYRTCRNEYSHHLHARAAYLGQVKSKGRETNNSIVGKVIAQAPEVMSSAAAAAAGAGAGGLGARFFPARS